MVEVSGALQPTPWANGTARRAAWVARTVQQLMVLDHKTQRYAVILNLMTARTPAARAAQLRKTMTALEAPDAM